LSVERAEERQFRFTPVFAKGDSEMAKTQKETKVVKINRAAAINQVIAKLNGSTDLDTLAAAVEELVTGSGGEANLRQTVQRTRRALETLAAAGVVKLTRPTTLLVQRVK
jgi:hypothetical protein